MPTTDKPSSDEIRAAMEFERTFGRGLPEHKIKRSTAHIRTLAACVRELYDALEGHVLMADAPSAIEARCNDVLDRYRAALEGDE
jgi:hypothetical protein